MPERPEGKVPWPKSEAELLAYIREMALWPQAAENSDEGYGRCVYAVANAALATYYYMAHVIGITGFQASCADLEFLSQVRHMEHGCMILNGEDLLYPQYNLLEKTREWIEKTRPQLAEKARALIAEREFGGALAGVPVASAVMAHWRALAALEGE